MLTRWMDNNMVTVAYGVNPTQFSHSEKNIIQVPRPHVVGVYNKFMEGTDHIDEDLTRYRISICSKKWH